MDEVTLTKLMAGDLPKHGAFSLRNPAFIENRKKVEGRKLKVAETARESDKKDKSIPDQHAANASAARKVYGLEPGEFSSYEDEGKSASNYGVPRPGYDEMCYGQLAVWGALDVIIAWAVNRLGRNLKEGLLFMWLCWYNDVKILVVKDYLADIKDGGDGSGGIYSMRRAKDWKHFKAEFDKAEDESDGKSGDIIRGHEANREKNRLDGPVPGGWKRVYHPETGKFSHNEVDLDRARVIVRMIRELAGNSTKSSVAYRLNRDGVPPFTRTRKDGSPCRRREEGRWQGRTVEVTALNPAHIGKITAKKFEGKNRVRDVTDLKPGAALDYFPIVRGRTETTAWTAGERDILGWHGTEEEWIALWYAARDNVLAASGGVFNISKVRPGGSAHLQSFIARCGVCGGPVRMATYVRRAGKLEYLSCEKSGHVSVREDWADEALHELVTAKLSRLVTEGGYPAEEPGKLADALKRRQKAAEFWDKAIAHYKQDASDFEGLVAAEKQKKEKLAELDAEVATLRIPAVVREYMDTGGDPALIAAKWHGKDKSAQRAGLKAMTARIAYDRHGFARHEFQRLTEDERRKVARGQLRVEWAPEYWQDADACRVAETEHVRAAPPEGSKWCTVCNETFPVDAEHFYALPSGADGFMNVCKRCHKARVARRKAARSAPEE